MHTYDLTESERKVWEAAATGARVNLRKGDSDLDSPERWQIWAPERNLRAEVIAALLVGDGPSAAAIRGVRVQGARITGSLDLEAATLRCPLALMDCYFDSDVTLSEATAPSVRLSGSHVPAVRARQLQTRGDLRLDEGFATSGGVELEAAHIGGDLVCSGGRFSNATANGRAIDADLVTVDGEMDCDAGFSATGEVRLVGAHIGGQFICSGGRFSNANGHALSADSITINGDMFCDAGFSATGEVHLLDAHLGAALSCRGGRFSSANGTALDLSRATLNGPLFMDSALIEGILDLTAARTSAYQDDKASWPRQLRLDGFVYDAIKGVSANERLEWLNRNVNGYSPQIYEQLAAVYHRAGSDGDARRVLIAKKRRATAEGNTAGKAWGYLLEVTVGYGYRTWLALVWLVGLLFVGYFVFLNAYTLGDLTPDKGASVPPFNSFLYTLDLLLPVASLHQRDGWIARGVTQWWSAFFIVMGWILASAIVLSLTGLLKRDIT